MQYSISDQCRTRFILKSVCVCPSLPSDKGEAFGQPRSGLSWQPHAGPPCAGAGVPGSLAAAWADGALTVVVVVHAAPGAAEQEAREGKHVDEGDAGCSLVGFFLRWEGDCEGRTVGANTIFF